MKSLHSLICRALVCATVLVGVGAPENQASGQDTSFYLQQNVHRVKQWLGSGPNAQGWRNFLDLGVLETLVAQGYQASPEALREIHDRLGSATPGLQHPHFVALRLALADHVEAIEAGQAIRGELANGSAAGTPTFAPVTNHQLQNAANRLLTEMRLLRQYFRENLWGVDRPQKMQDLQVDELINGLQRVDFLDDQTDIEGDEQFTIRQRKIVYLARLLRPLKPKYRTEAARDANVYIQLTSRRMDYLDRLLTYAFDEAASARIFDSALSDFSNQLNRLAVSGDRRAQLEIGQSLGWLRDLGQASDWTGAVRQNYSHPNFHVEISENFVNRLAARNPVRDVRWLDETILDNRVLGYAFTNGQALADFVDDPFQAHVSIHLMGTINSNGRTPKTLLEAYSRSHADFEARRSLFVNAGGLTEFAPYVAANLSTQFLGTSSRLGIINRIADQQYLKQKLQAEAIGAYRAETRIFEQFSEQTDEALVQGREALDKINSQYYQSVKEVGQFRYDFAAAQAGQEPDDAGRPLRLPEFHLRTTDHALRIDGLLEDFDTLAAPTSPPRGQSPADVRVQIHESLLSNFIGPLFSGQTINSSQFSEMAVELAGESPEGFGVEEDDEFLIVFETGKPIQIVFDDQQIVLLVNATNLIKDTNETGPMFIRSVFHVIEHEGSLKLVRVGKPVIDFVEEGEKSIEQVTTRSLIQDAINAAVADDDPMETAIELPANLIPIDKLQEAGVEETDELRNFRLVQLTIQDGWLSLGWNNVADFAPTAQTPWLETPAIHSPPTATRENDFIRSRNAQQTGAVLSPESR